MVGFYHSLPVDVLYVLVDSIIVISSISCLLGHGARIVYRIELLLVRLLVF